jgi:hypothetical protein
VRRMGGALESRTGMTSARWAKQRLSRPGHSVERRRRLAQAGGERAKQIADTQVGHSLEHKYGEARAQMDTGRETQARISAKRTRLSKMQSEHAAALRKAADAKAAREEGLTDFSLFTSPLERDRAAAKHGAEELRHRKSAARLQVRMDDLQTEISGKQSALTEARQTVEKGESTKQATGRSYTHEQAEQHARFLDAQTALPRGKRDHARAAGIAGYGQREFEGLNGPRKRSARLEIDHELDKRQELGNAAADMAASTGTGSVGKRDQRDADKELKQRFSGRMHSKGNRRPSASVGEDQRSTGGQRSTGDPRPDTRNREGVADGHTARQRHRKSPVLDDASAVAAKRKRQLGQDRP